MDRRKFLKFAGIAGAAEAFFGKLHPALAQTWQKLGPITTFCRVRLPWRGALRKQPTVAGGTYHTVLLRSDGLVFASGENTKGQLGDNTIVDKSSFVQTLGVSNVVAVAAGEGHTGGRHTVALRSDGLVFATGSGTSGQLGDSTIVDKSTFVQALGISNAVVVGCGAYNTYAIRSDGFVFATGSDTAGHLGYNTSGVAKSTFVQSIGISNAVAVVGGYAHTVALRSDGLVFACGYNNSGQLGNNTTVSKSTFVQATGISNAVAIACGYTHTVALRSDGLVFGCGRNASGQLGDNTTVSKSTFVQAIGISNAVAIACGYYFSVALRSDGLVFGTGQNATGQLGDNTVANKVTFVQAIGISNAVAVSCGKDFTIALRSDGLVFAAGSGANGRLGDNTTVSKSTFVQATGI